MLDFCHRQSRLLGVNSLDWDAQSCADILAALTPGFEENTLRLAIPIQSYGITESSKAYEQVLTRAASSKVVLKVLQTIKSSFKRVQPQKPN